MSYPICTVSGYFKRFYEIVGEYDTHKLAYEAMEEELKDEYGIEFYKSYDTFRTAKSAYLKNRYKKNNKKPTVFK